MEQLYIIESGIKRKAEYHSCEYCGKEFLRRKNASRPKKYCCKKCHEISRKNRIIVQCSNCGKDIEKKVSQLKNAKHGFYFCNRKCKEEAQKLGGNCPSIRPSHFGTGTGEHSYRDKMKKELMLGCIDCGIKEDYLLLVHHKDGNRQNNKKENLEVVCRNCHAKRHLYLKDGKWCFHTASITPRDILLKI